MLLFLARPTTCCRLWRQAQIRATLRLQVPGGCLDQAETAIEALPRRSAMGRAVLYQTRFRGAAPAS